MSLKFYNEFYIVSYRYKNTYLIIERIVIILTGSNISNFQTFFTFKVAHQGFLKLNDPLRKLDTDKEMQFVR